MSPIPGNGKITLLSRAGSLCKSSRLRSWLQIPAKPMTVWPPGQSNWIAIDSISSANKLNRSRAGLTLPANEISGGTPWLNSNTQRKRDPFLPSRQLVIITVAPIYLNTVPMNASSITAVLLRHYKAERWAGQGVCVCCVNNGLLQFPPCTSVTGLSNAMWICINTWQRKWESAVLRGTS